MSGGMHFLRSGLNGRIESRKGSFPLLRVGVLIGFFVV